MTIDRLQLYRDYQQRNSSNVTERESATSHAHTSVCAVDSKEAQNPVSVPIPISALEQSVDILRAQLEELDGHISYLDMLLRPCLRVLEDKASQAETTDLHPALITYFQHHQVAIESRLETIQPLIRVLSQDIEKLREEFVSDPKRSPLFIHHMEKHKKSALNEAERKSYSALYTFYSNKLRGLVRTASAHHDCVLQLHEQSLRTSAFNEFLLRTGGVALPIALNPSQSLTRRRVASWRSEHTPSIHRHESDEDDTEALLEIARNSFADVTHALILRDIAIETNLEVRALERDMEELGLMFTDAKVLAMAQGDCLNDIYRECKRVHEILQEGQNETQQAEKIHKSIVKGKRMLCCCTGKILLIFFVMVLFSLAAITLIVLASRGIFQSSQN